MSMVLRMRIRMKRMSSKMRARVSAHSPVSGPSFLFSCKGIDFNNAHGWGNCMDMVGDLKPFWQRFFRPLTTIILLPPYYYVPPYYYHHTTITILLPPYYYHHTTILILLPPYYYHHTTITIVLLPYYHHNATPPIGRICSCASTY